MTPPFRDTEQVEAMKVLFLRRVQAMLRLKSTVLMEEVWGQYSYDPFG